MFQFAIAITQSGQEQIGANAMNRLLRSCRFFELTGIPLLREHSETETLSVAPDTYPLRFDFCLALRACEIQFARRKLTRARALASSHRIQKWIFTVF